MLAWDEQPRRRLSQPLLFAGLAALHGLLLFSLGRWSALLPDYGDEPPLELLQLAPEERPANEPAPSAARRERRRRPLPAAAATSSPPVESPAAQPPAIDWSHEAQLAARHQSEVASGPQPRSLDDHGRHNNDAPVESKSKPEFGWDRAATHRVESVGGLLIIHPNDRCVIGVLLILPMMACGIGQIPARGDLFEHMRDAKDGNAQP